MFKQALGRNKTKGKQEESNPYYTVFESVI